MSKTKIPLIPAAKAREISQSSEIREKVLAACAAVIKKHAESGHTNCEVIFRESTVADMGKVYQSQGQQNNLWESLSKGAKLAVEELTSKELGYTINYGIHYQDGSQFTDIGIKLLISW